MGMQTAQAAQPISQQQPSTSGQPQGKGNFNFQPPQSTDQSAQQQFGGPNGQPQGKSQGGFAQNMQMPPPTQQPQQYHGKGSTTNSATSGQPRMGQSNPYPNTIQPWDNASIQPQTKSGKGKGY